MEPAIQIESHKGTCPICGPTIFNITGPILREHYKCSNCNSIPRFRAIFHVLQNEFPNWRELRIHESSPAGAVSEKLRKECKNYSCSFYLPEVPFGTVDKGRRSEDLTKLSFPNESFDLLVTQDVMEHVFHPELAFKEIERVLSPKGAHIFTVPVYPRDETVVRAKMAGDKIEHLLPPNYHGAPYSKTGALVVHEWGRDFVKFISKRSNTWTQVFIIKDRELGIDGKFLEVFISRKLY